MLRGTGYKDSENRETGGNTEYWRRYNRGFFHPRPGYRPYWNKWRYYHNPGPYFYNTIYPLKYNIYEYDPQLSVVTQMQNILNDIYLEFGGKLANIDILTMQKLKDRMNAFDMMLDSNLTRENQRLIKRMSTYQQLKNSITY